MSNHVATQPPQSLIQSKLKSSPAKKQTQTLSTSSHICIDNYRKKCNLTYKTNQSATPCPDCVNDEITSYWQCQVMKCQRIICDECKQWQESREEEKERNINESEWNDSGTENEDEFRNHNSKKRKKSFKDSSRKKKRKIDVQSYANYQKDFNECMDKMKTMKNGMDNTVLNYKTEIQTLKQNNVALTAEKNDLNHNCNLLEKDLKNKEIIEKENENKMQLLTNENQRLKNELGQTQINVNEWKDKYEKREKENNDLHKRVLNLENVETQLNVEINKNEPLKVKLIETEKANKELIENCAQVCEAIENEKQECEEKMHKLKIKKEEYEKQKERLKTAYYNGTNKDFQGQLQIFLNNNFTFE